MSSIYFIGNNNYSKYHQSNINECLEWCLSQYILVLDIETQRKYPKGTYDESFYSAGLDPRLSKICMFQIGNLDRQYIIDARCIDLTLLMPVLESNSILKIIHNAQFECKHILHNYGVRIQEIWDTMIVEKLLYNGYPQSYSLANIAEKRLGIKSNDTSLFDIFDEEIEEYEYEFEEFGFDFPKKETVDKSVRMQFVEWGDKPFTEEQIEYGAGDLTIPYRIFAKQREHEQTDYYPKYGIELENKTTFVLAEMSYHGIPINTEKWLQTESNNKEKYNRQRQAIDEYIIDNEPQFSFDVDIFTNKRTCSIDWGSPQKVINLFKYWKICPKEKSKQTGKLEYSVGAKALFKKLPNSHKEMFMKDKFPESINDKDDFTLSYLLYKKTEQLIQAFGSSWLSCVHPISGRIHTNYNQLMISTRLSSSHQNIQQIPRSKDFRGCIESDGLLVCADYTAQEVYSAAYVHKSKPLLKFFKEGDPVYGTDIHSFMAAKTFKLVYKDDDFFCDAKSPERQQQKIISFQSIYGGSEFTLSDSLGISAEEAKGIQDGFIKGFELEDSFTHYKKHAMDYGWVELDIKTGKRWFFSEYKKMLDAKEDALSYYPDNFNRFTKEDKEKWKAEQKIENPIISELWRTHMILKGKLERKSLNLRVQGLCASMTKKALVDISEFLWKKNLNNNFKMIISCHDECVGDLDKNHLEDKEKYGKVVQHYMEKASAFFLDGLVSKADPIYSKFWAK